MDPKRIARILRPGIGEDLRALVRLSARHAGTRALLNRVYRLLSPVGQETWHRRFADLFRANEINIEAGEWRIDFIGQLLRLPLRRTYAGLDWDAALSALGHEPEVKQTYAAMLQSTNRPRVFFDVGANLGLHSLLLLAHGVQTVSFEPNAEAVDYLRVAAALNRLAPIILPVAVGARRCAVQLAYPARESWLGSTDPAVQARISRRGETVIRAVAQITLDDYVAESGLLPDLIKIDTEGNELSVLVGAAKTISRQHPRIIFESWRDRSRAALDETLRSSGYKIAALQFDRTLTTSYITSKGFMDSTASNFLAVA